MKKIFYLILGLLFFTHTLFVIPQTSAQMLGGPPELQAPTPPINPSKPFNISETIPPQQNSEGVSILALFDKNGTAKNAAKITLDAENKQELENFTVFLPGKNIKLLRAVHEKWLLKKSCDYGYSKPVPLPLDQPSATTGVIQDQMYPNPQYCPPYYVNIYTSLFPATETGKDGLLVTITARPDLSIKSQESILLLYEIPTLARKFLTNYHFKILTPQIPLSSTAVQAGLLTKDGLYFKGANYYGGEGSYQPNFKALEKAKNLNEEENQELNAFSNDILYQGIIRKSDSDISQNSSYEIKGMYGKNAILLYTNEFLIAVAVLAVLIVGIYFLVRFFSRKSPDFKSIFQTIIIAFVTSLIVTLTTGIILLYFRDSPVFMR